MRLIPAIDLREGKVVRLERGDDGRRTTYRRQPVEVLAELAGAGVGLVHVVDLDAAFGEPPQRPLIERLVSRGPAIELGGGLRDRDAVRWALGAGVERVILGSLVARDTAAFAALAEAFPRRLVPAVEVAEGLVRVAGWREAVPLSAGELARRLRGLPCPAVLVTDVERDGTLAGPNLELTRRVAELSGLPALVSGGMRSLDDLRAASRVPGIAGAIVGKALYEGVFSVEQALAAARGEAS